MAFKIGTKKILSEQNISKIIMLGIGLRDKLENAEKGLISDYDNTKTYTRGQAVYYNNYLYECKYTTTGDFDESKWQLIGDNLSLITKQDIEALINLSDEDVKTLQSLILDTSIELSHVWSSSKTYEEIQNAIKKGETFTLKELSKKMGASYKVVTTTDEVTSTEFLYLISNSTAYDIYALIDGVATKLGDTTIDLSNYYTKNEIDNDFLKKADADGKYIIQTSFNSHTSDTDIHTSATEKASYVKKIDIVDNLTSTDADKPLSANQGNVLDNKISKKIDKDKIVTTLDSTVTDEQIPSAKVVYDNLDKVFQSVSNGKELIANAITDKGVDTNKDDTFAIMADNIEKIDNSGTIGVEFVETKQTIRNDISSNHYTFKDDGIYIVICATTAIVTKDFNYVGNGSILYKKKYGFKYDDTYSCSSMICIVNAKQGDKISHSHIATLFPTIIQRINIL